MRQHISYFFGGHVQTFGTETEIVCFCSGRFRIGKQGFCVFGNSSYDCEIRQI